MENESKMAGENNEHVIWVLLLSLLALITSSQQQLVVLYNLIFQLQQQQAMIMHLTHSAAVPRHFHLSRRMSTRGLGERLWRKPDDAATQPATPDKIVDVWQLNTVKTRLPPSLFFVPSNRNFRAKAVYMVLGSS